MLFCFIFVTMINEIRNTVMYILNKENFGYMTPDEYNSYATLAQMDIYTELFKDLSDAHNKTIIGQNGEGYQDLIRMKEEAIEIFMMPDVALSGTQNTFNLPVDTFTLEKVYYLTEVIEKVSHTKIRTLLNSDRTAPTTMFPAYTQQGNEITVYPSTITSDVTATYIRYPRAPKWTYVVAPGGDAPIFNQSDNNYQDFELSAEFRMDLIVRILQYAGLTLREADIVSAAKQEELVTKQENNV